MFYFDPPYILTNATYNDGKRGFNGWDEEQEKDLLAFLEKIDANGQMFMLSNLLFHNGKTNENLIGGVKKKVIKYWNSCLAPADTAAERKCLS